jgi:hypothetical protein
MPEKGSPFALIIPVYNEGDRLADLIGNIQKNAPESS